ncbi:MAG: DUF1934 domain-containing protein [Ruminococcaceae bacterium]|nr:DUF1934 domain-containing protein [Oscillospiraceae bacterium]
MSTQEIKKNIKIKIRSLISEVNLPDDSPFSQKGCSPKVDYTPDKNEKDYDECVEFSTVGTLTIKDNYVEITYKENEELGMADIESTLRFKKARPTMINLIRRGAAPASLMFDTEFPRRNCSYCLGNLPFSFCICTKNVENHFGESEGKIVLDYEIEMHGVVTEHNIYTLEYKE